MQPAPSGPRFPPSRQSFGSGTRRRVRYRRFGVPLEDRLLGLVLKQSCARGETNGSRQLLVPGILVGMAFVLEPHVAGELGSKTKLDPTTHPPTVEELHYVLDSSESDDIVESFPVFLVSARLAVPSR